MEGPVKKPHLLIVGHGRHGKDTVSEMLQRFYGLSFISSSEFVGREIIFDKIGHEYGGDFDSMFADRVNRRAEWMRWIAAYNTPDETRTASTMFRRGHHIYCGMRRVEELRAGREAGLFDSIWWVDRSLHLPPEGADSMTITPMDADVFINNNGTLPELRREVLRAYTRIQHQ